MPELPEVESARSVLERSALGRRIVAADDTDGWVCRPHPPGEIALALVGTELTAAHRRGKTLWCDTPGGPVLGIHLGMSGKIVIADADGREVDGGDHWEFGRQPGDFRFSRFSLDFADGGVLHLVDPRRLGRIRLDPPLDALGPDAALVTAAEFGERLGWSRAPVKARLLDQHVVAGIGNLLADEILWRAGLVPGRPVDGLTPAERRRLHRTVRSTVDDALHDGGVHTLPLVPHRRPGGRCPRDDAELCRATVGGRTTFWCPAHQR
ncbi:Fpg/Nei family DNA glycosylase [Actinomycetospora sp. TBRC 11914]|uniref:Fpg/Nei family DNA glycosylase n=1 Tax=Actinomycetospora sp. TBRC 11914 TaxID=2729387 RepID=UPI00145EE1D4|nr:DNA-formamidopyrimidine glycosylase family protein [Actinomycetospora sp. TBRC 11914]NMO92308.1 formamidopyrimidine-DNA glycosylase [Actinomycetospora sp. TBRC 11914]